MPDDKVRTLPASGGDPLVDNIDYGDDHIGASDMDQTPPNEKADWSNVTPIRNDLFPPHQDTVHIDQGQPVERMRTLRTPEADTGPGLNAALADKVQRHQSRYP